MPSFDGFYFAYMSGAESQGMAMFVFRDGILVGADPLGVIFDGHYAEGIGGNTISGRVTVSAPPNGQLIQGVNTGPNGISYEMAFQVPAAVANEPFVRLETPLGPVNMRLKKLRGFTAG